MRHTFLLTAFKYDPPEDEGLPVKVNLKLKAVVKFEQFKELVSKPALCKPYFDGNLPGDKVTIEAGRIRFNFEFISGLGEVLTLFKGVTIKKLTMEGDGDKGLFLPMNTILIECVCRYSGNENFNGLPHLLKQYLVVDIEREVDRQMDVLDKAQGLLDRYEARKEGIRQAKEGAEK